MADETGTSGWILEPPGEGEVQLHIALGDGIELTPEIRAAIDNLVESLQQVDVAGYAKCNPKCPSLAGCSQYGCSKLYGCKPLISSDCLAFVEVGFRPM
jgi:hypothetical protein